MRENRGRRGLVHGLCAGLCLMLLVPAVAQADEAEDRGAEILAMFELPAAVQELRESGVDEEQVREALRAFREAPAQEDAEERRTRAGEAAETFRAEAEAAREHGPVENFGQYVRARVHDDGLRGRALAERIREEREHRGGGAEAAEAAQERRPAAAPAESPRGTREERGRPAREEAAPRLQRPGRQADDGAAGGGARPTRGTRGGGAEEQQEESGGGGARPTRTR